MVRSWPDAASDHDSDREMDYGRDDVRETGMTLETVIEARRTKGKRRGARKQEAHAGSQQRSYNLRGHFRTEQKRGSRPGVPKGFATALELVDLDRLKKRAGEWGYWDASEGDLPASHSMQWADEVGRYKGCREGSWKGIDEMS